MTAAADPQPGDVFVTRSPGALGKIIRLGERLHGGGKAAYWNHAGIVVDNQGGTVEAAARGVVRNTITAHPTRLILPFPEGVDRAKVAHFAVSQLGLHYGYFEVCLLGLDCILPLRFHDHGKRSWICSELAAAALVAGGWSPSLISALTMPSDLVIELTGTKVPASVTTTDGTARAL